MGIIDNERYQLTLDNGKVLYLEMPKVLTDYEHEDFIAWMELILRSRRRRFVRREPAP